MDELTIEGKLYISSKRAAKVSGYAKDYIGQLCREGRVDSKLVGRSWYVYEPSIREHRFNDERSKAKKKGLDEPAESPVLESTDETPLEKVWESPSYTSESFEPLPAIEEPLTTAESTADEPKHLSDMQSAWQEWFATRKDTRTEDESVQLPEERYEPVVSPVEAYSAVETPEVVPVRMIVSDIAPKRERYETSEETIAVRHYESPRKENAGQKRRHKTAISPLVVKSLLGALIVFSVSVMLIATGLIENLHIGSVAETPILQFFQGSTVLNK